MNGFRAASRELGAGRSEATTRTLEAETTPEGIETPLSFSLADRRAADLVAGDAKTGFVMLTNRNAVPLPAALP